MEISNLKKYHKNPRKITEKQHTILENSMQEFGDLSGVVVNVRNNEVIGGNQRTSIFQKYASEVKIQKADVEQPNPNGNVAIGHIYFRGNVFNYREVNWDEDKESRANILANKAGGFWDNDMLANEFDSELLMSAGFEDFELGFFDNKGDVNMGDRDQDQNTLQDTLNTYLDGSIKQIVLYFKKEEYDEIIERLERCQTEMGAEDFTEVFKEFLALYERAKGI